MKCQHCGKKEATVHLLEMIEGRRRALWLCADCAEVEQWRRIGNVGRKGPGGDDDDPGERGLFRGPEDLGHESDSLTGFLGQDAFVGASGEVAEPACPQCGYVWADFQNTHRLGCAACYVAFRPRLLPMLAGFHRHASHLGKVPPSRDGRGSVLVELTKLRVALEKAIAAEEFEKAAALRDRMRQLESGAPPREEAE
ncbi:MAG: UvrB/UvrC motif-containing protein [bacterium]